MNVMIPGGWNSQREVSNVQHNPCPVKGALEKKVMIAGGWNSQHDSGHVEGTLEEEVFPGG